MTNIEEYSVYGFDHLEQNDIERNERYDFHSARWYIGDLLTQIEQLEEEGLLYCDSDEERDVIYRKINSIEDEIKSIESKMINSTNYGST